MKKGTLFLLVLICAWTLNGQIVISEISYNPPESNQDSLEYLELYNAGNSSVNLIGYSFLTGINHVFGDITFPSESFLTLCVDSSAFKNAFGFSALQWDGNNLNNSGEPIVLIDPFGTRVDSVNYSDSDPWPDQNAGTDGVGGSIELCDLLGDNSMAANWRVSTNFLAVNGDGTPIFGTPNSNNSASCTSSADITVVTDGLNFVPSDITINVGQTVQWINTGGLHNVNGSVDTFPNNPLGFLSGEPDGSAWSFEFQFSEIGFYEYQCDEHSELGMIGSVTVEDTTELKTADLIITEILYNDPGSDSLEFIEIYNRSESSVNLQGFALGDLVSYTFGDTVLASANVIVVAKHSDKFEEAFGFSPLQWDSNTGLSNSGSVIYLRDTINTIIDSVSYEDNVPWPEEADGFGYSLSLCDPTGNNDFGLDWRLANTPVGYEINMIEIVANPGYLAPCEFRIGEINGVDSQSGIPLEDGLAVRTSGIVYGINMREPGLQFTLIDEFGSGIGTINLDDNFGYEVTEGDRLNVEGTIGHFNGLTQISLTKVEQESMDNSLIPPTIVTDLSENTESQLVRMTGVYLVDTEAWDASGEAFNVLMTNGSDTITVRVDEQTNIIGLEYPTGSFNITGIGGQFDSSEPHTDGYQLFPRYLEDIAPFIPFVEPYPEHSIAEITTVDAEGVVDSLGVGCTLTGVVHGVNFNGGGLQFTLIDDFNDDIEVYRESGNLNYVVVEGDSLVVKGLVDQVFGQTRLLVDSIQWVSSNATVKTPQVVSELTEDYESNILRIENLDYVDPSQWFGDGQSFSVLLTDGDNTFEIFIDNDTEMSSLAAPEAPFIICGIGEQNDPVSPFDSGYRLKPRYLADIKYPEPLPEYTIGTVTTNDLNGIPDSIGVECRLRGIVHGINLNSNGLAFTLIDDNGDGIQVFNAIDDLAYNVNQEDQIIVQGEIKQFNGLARIDATEIEFINGFNILQEPMDVSVLDESTESQMIRLSNMNYVDPTEWQGDGSSFEVRITDGSNEYIMLIDDNTEMSDMEAPNAPFHVVGIGSQNDVLSPFDMDYLFTPRYLADFDPINSIPSVKSSGFYLSPVPASDWLNIEWVSEPSSLTVLSMMGQEIMVFPVDNRIDVSQLKAGSYLLQIEWDGYTLTKVWVKID